ncbi:HlyD family type I secretion periplasmic adaptor subunit [Erythrobacter sp. YJ-T3-07]|uniref:HlyD family type I secretion periplasmic adaptor subunit n=1 Tax=Erythrobacter sp. YJ-T3-07 TaxID=2793063 RepID=UPI0018D2DE36|nr:HlyD family type I secretion periplasmic adaptor subunit [Erythrobacter sp. YJ-T3-07]
MNANTTPPPADGSGQNRSAAEPAELLRSPFAPGPEVREVGAPPPEDQEPSGLETLIERFRPGGAANLLLVMILLFTVAAVTWAAVTELDRTVRATGRVIPLGRLQVVSNQEGGIVSEILVETGDLVDKGQPMVLLDLTEAGSDLQSKQATLDALNAKIARLEAEIAGRRPVYPVADNPETAAQIRIEQSLHAARLAELADAESVARARIGQAQRSVTQAEAALAGRRTAAQLARSEADTIAGLVAKGIEPRLAGQQAEAQASMAQSEAEQALAAVTQARDAVSEARAGLTQVRNSWRAQAGDELATAQAELASRQEVMPALVARVERSTITSPVRGRVNRVLVTTIGAAVAPGAEIVEVVASSEQLAIEASVAPQDIASVRLGQRATIDISAYDSAVYGSIHGEVISISPDATVNERTGESFYAVQLRADLDELREKTGREQPLTAGMTASVNLLGDKRSVLSYILTPITRLRDRAFRE